MSPVKADAAPRPAPPGADGRAPRRTGPRLGRSRARRQLLAVWLLRALLLVVVVGAWWYATGPGGVSPLLLPKLGPVGDRLGALLGTGQLWSDLGLTVVEILLAFLVSAAAGVLVGFWAGRTELRARIVEPLVAWGYMAPLVLFYPLFIAWFDIGMTSKVLYGALSGFFPIAFNALRGFRAVDPRHLRVARAFGASAVQTDWLVKSRAALPMVMAGVRVGAALDIIAVILAEMLASSRGLGYELAQASQTLQIPDVFALILILLVFVALMQLAIQKAGTPRHQQ
ncbi:ABC transporter permease [Streptomyces sp. NPDC050560]|uniref:ABC transporter permease n=1 Tax=Streptomyces sp. NPDC050560 TaxID=3365630 RepID=UPI0037A472DB